MYSKNHWASLSFPMGSRSGLGGPEPGVSNKLLAMLMSLVATLTSNTSTQDGFSPWNHLELIRNVTLRPPLKSPESESIM